MAQCAGRPHSAAARTPRPPSQPHHIHAHAPPPPPTPMPRRTRSTARRPAAGADALPDDLWISILGLVGASDPSSLGRALCSAPQFARLSSWAWREAVQARWPAWTAVAVRAGPVSAWRRLHELFSLRQRELDAVEAEAALASSRAAAASAPPSVTPRHRSVLVEWLAEVRGDVRAAANRSALSIAPDGRRDAGNRVAGGASRRARGTQPTHGRRQSPPPAP